MDGPYFKRNGRMFGHYKNREKIKDNVAFCKCINWRHAEFSAHALTLKAFGYSKDVIVAAVL